MDYNEMKLTIYEACDNSEITEDERDILLERLDESSESDDITLEEVMDYISDYISEGAYKTAMGGDKYKYGKIVNKNSDKHKELINKALNSQSKYGPSSGEFKKAMRDLDDFDDSEKKRVPARGALVKRSNLSTRNGIVDEINYYFGSDKIKHSKQTKDNLNAKADSFDKEYSKSKQEKLHAKRELMDKLKNHDSKGATAARSKYNSADIGILAAKANRDLNKSRIKSSEEAFNKGVDSMRTAKKDWMAKHSGPDAKPNPTREKRIARMKELGMDTKHIKESVDDLRLSVYEAYENGAISESDKLEFLEYLNLENYE